MKYFLKLFIQIFFRRYFLRFLVSVWNQFFLHANNIVWNIFPKVCTARINWEIKNYTGDGCLIVPLAMVQFKMVGCLATLPLPAYEYLILCSFFRTARIPNLFSVYNRLELAQHTNLDEVFGLTRNYNRMARR